MCMQFFMQLGEGLGCDSYLESVQIRGLVTSIGPTALHLGKNIAHTQSKTSWAISLAPILILRIFLKFMLMSKAPNQSPTLDLDSTRI